MRIIIESEEELESFLYDHMKKNDGLCLIDGEKWDSYERQTNLGLYGRTDIIKCRASECGKIIDICIVEVKKGFIDYKAINQSLRYYHCASNLYSDLYDIDKNIQLNLSVQLVGNEFKYSDDSPYSYIYAPDFLKCYTVDFDVFKGVVISEVEREDDKSRNSHPSLFNLIIKATPLISEELQSFGDLVDSEYVGDEYQQDENNEDEYYKLSIAEAAKMYGKGRRTVYDDIAKGILSTTTKHNGIQEVSISELSRVYGDLNDQ